jgi:hypothetical protein
VELSTAVGSTIDRDGTLTSKGCKTTTGGLKDLLTWDSDVARQHVRVAQQVGPRFALDGAPLEPVLPATAAAFAGATTMRHVGVIATLMNSRSASRISLADRVSIEASLGEAAMIFCPREVRIMGQELLAAADQDGPEPATPTSSRSYSVNTANRWTSGGLIAGSHYGPAAPSPPATAAAPAQAAIDHRAGAKSTT